MSTWKPLQMPTTGPPSSANFGDRRHDRREPGDGAGPEVVAVGEAAGDDHRVDIADRAVAVPQQSGLAAEVGDGLDHVLLAVRTREEDDADFGAHETRASMRTTASSITGLVRKREHISSTSRRADSFVGRLDAEPDALADAHVADAVEPEMRKRPFDGGALRVGDAGSQLHLDDDRELHLRNSRHQATHRGTDR